MLRRFLRDSLAYSLSGLLTRGIAILLVPIYTRILAPADYGLIDIVTVIAGIVASIAPLEIVQAVARYYPDTSDADERRGLASTALYFAAAGYLAFLGVGLLGAEAIAQVVLGPNHESMVIRLAVVSVAANGMLYVVQSQLRWSLRSAKYAATAIAYSIVSVAASITMVVAWRTGVAGVFAGQVVGAIVGILMSLYGARDAYGARFEADKLRMMLAFSAPFVPSTLGLIVALYIDRVTIAAFLSLTEVGLFGVAYRAALLTQVLLMGFQTAITPIIYSAHREPTTPAALARIFRWFALVVLVLWLGLGLLAYELLQLATTQSYLGAAAVIPILVPAVALSGAYVFMPGASIAGQTRRIATINIASGVLNLVLNLFLVPRFGIRGAALATLATSIVTFMANTVLSQRAYPVPHNWRLLGTAVGLTSLLIALGWMIGPTSTTQIARLAFLVAGMVGVSLLLFRQADARDLISSGTGS